MKSSQLITKLISENSFAELPFEAKLIKDLPTKVLVQAALLHLIDAMADRAELQQEEFDGQDALELCEARWPRYSLMARPVILKEMHLNESDSVDTEPLLSLSRGIVPPSTMGVDLELVDQFFKRQ